MRPVHDMVGALDLLYRAFYRAVLARLPERGAVAMGQWGLRHLPLDRLGMFRNPDPASRRRWAGCAWRIR